LLRDVRFSSTDGATFTNRVVQNLTFAGGIAGYSLTVPPGTVRIGAKTAWHLRQTLPPSFSNQQAVLNFALRGGDINGSNLVEIEDYFQLAAAWHQASAASDIDGDGLVESDDYFLLANHWYDAGDAE
jgi:hypothetical protein